jgi:hypothetical protein
MQNRIEHLFLLPGGLIFLLSISVTQGAFAHSGGTDATGCHTDRKTGEYHCHGGASTSGEETEPMKPTEGCGPKYYCREMASCAEAIHYFKDCGLTRLDGDNDGVPCETICGHH